MLCEISKCVTWSSSWGCRVPVICYVRYLNVSPGVVAGAAVVVAGGCWWHIVRASIKGRKSIFVVEHIVLIHRLIFYDLPHSIFALHLFYISYNTKIKKVTGLSSRSSSHTQVLFCALLYISPFRSASHIRESMQFMVMLIHFSAYFLNICITFVLYSM